MTLKPEEVLKKSKSLREKLSTQEVRDKKRKEGNQKWFDEINKEFNPFFHECVESAKKNHIPLDKDKIWSMVNPHLKQGTELEVALDYIDDLFEEVTTAPKK